MADKEKSGESKEAGANPEKSKLIKIVIIAIGATLSICGMMMAGFYFMMKGHIESSHETLKEEVQEQMASKDAKKSESKDGKETKVKSEGKSEGKEGKKDKEVQKPLFYKFLPAFIVNISSKEGTKYLQIDVSLMTKKQSVMDSIEAFAPVLRNDLIIFYSSQHYEDLQTPEAKDQLRQATLERMKKVLKENGGDAAIDQVLFTNFMIQ